VENLRGGGVSPISLITPLRRPGDNIVNTDSPFRRFPFDPIHSHVPFTDGEIEQSITERFEQEVRVAGDCLAIKSPERSFTYEQLNQTANRLARKILSLRGEHAEAIALMFDHGASILAAILAVLKTGKFYLALDPTYPRKRLGYMLADAGATLIITDGNNFSVASELAQDGKEVVDLDNLDDGFSLRGNILVENLDLAATFQQILGRYSPGVGLHSSTQASRRISPANFSDTLILDPSPTARLREALVSLWRLEYIA
jgi:non-ribosomal peptide synthetase component F